MKTADQPRPTTPAQTPPPPPLPLVFTRSSKMTAAHLAKLAIVYVRQSSPQQVLENRESTARQYALVDLAVALGWPRERVLVIDEDQGQSGRSVAGRAGFQRLLTEVTLDHVGLILSLEMSRLARSDKDWHHLLELCGVFGALLADQEGVYDAADPNDRLLLGLKGTMSTLELQTMRNRLDKGRLNKAQRGEYFSAVPLGYVLVANGELEMDPDEQARSVVRLLFDKFEELGSAYAVWHWLLDNGVRLPIRPRRGPNKGQLEWRRPLLSTILQVLHNPTYAGAYAHGRRPRDPKRPYTGAKGRSSRRLPPEQWQVLLRDRLPAYITWDRFLSNQQRLKQNQQRPETPGTPRQGGALLGGVLVCGRCQWRLHVNYRTLRHPYYICAHRRSCGSGPNCPGLAAGPLDELVSREVLRALEPAAVELSLQAEGDLRREREQLDRHWQQSLQRARYDAELAQRRYQAVDPDNRLVAATLERQWEAALRRERDLQDEYDRVCRQSLQGLSAEEGARIRELASDIPALWAAAETTNADRKAIIRCLVERVVVHLDEASEHGEATIHWAGGHESRHAFVRPVRTYDQLRDVVQLRQRLVDLRAAGKTAEQTADILNAEGFSPIDPRERFNRDIVRDLLLKLGLRGEQSDTTLLGPGEWRLRDLAGEVGVAWQTLREWAVRGWARGRQTKVLKLWILWADKGEVKRLRRLRDARSRGILGYPEELTTPKQLPTKRRSTT